MLTSSTGNCAGLLGKLSSAYAASTQRHLSSTIFALSARFLAASVLAFTLCPRPSVGPQFFTSSNSSLWQPRSYVE